MECFKFCSQNDVLKLSIRVNDPNPGPGWLLAIEGKKEVSDSDIYSHDCYSQIIDTSF